MINHKISGFYTHDFKEVKRITLFNERYNKLLESLGFLPRCFPAFGLKSDLEKETSHMEMKAEVYTIEDTDYFLRPTSEAIAYPLTYGDASLKTPYKWYSIGPVFRNESKYCRKYERHKEISFFHESHGIYSTQKKALEEVNQLIPKISQFLWDEGVPHVVNIRPLEDTFPGAVRTYAFDTITPEGKVLQILTLHYLGDNFSKAYKPGGSFYGICFGHSERIIGALSLHYKENIRWWNNPYSIVSYNSLVDYAKQRGVSLNRGCYEMLREFNCSGIEKSPGCFFAPENLDTMEGSIMDHSALLSTLDRRSEIAKNHVFKLFESNMKNISEEKYGKKLDQNPKI